ncbi:MULTISPECIES: hypothetical protein [Pseudomonas syringae group]|uniref:Uncharacterized protein n=2 Tax=Pseudomonas amygdali TaxID=47877 RepID=A0A0Q0BGF4_PSEAJ|nr:MULTISPECIES: hypothetical protein [Pseudomonas syringae group]KPX62414.1 Uncharacterized protein ALO35_02532 [Pseudomonas amygdali pv. lachrymans]AQX41758.1 hypothetical protein [Pseudomonas amygdali pv. tabaci]KPY76923.1 hypothetical protein ALO60_200147 [Pseudomonas amygdali pv. tabaci]RML83553.1 hypothetical protein ALQ89_200054 [Pseudomonas amygdali pv. tabaci]RMR85675.1 hypothetical protein ALP77_200074 [Pseudomonas amygdali pv. tabaci]
MNDKKTLEELRHAELLESIESIKAPLSVMALLGLLDELYSKEERRALYSEYETLRKASHAGYESLMATHATVDPGIGWDAREQKYGKEAATEHMRPHMEALEAKKKTDQKVTDFEAKHPQIKRLVRLKGEIGKGQYEQ